MIKIITNTLEVAILIAVIHTEGFVMEINNLEDKVPNLDSGSFSYTVAVLRKHTYLTAGALISDSWVITDGNELFGLQAIIREIKVRVGSFNYKKGGILIPVKYFETHPKFNDTSPSYDVALVQLSKAVGSTSAVSPIKILKHQKGIATSHFIVTYWPVLMPQESQERSKIPIEQQRNLLSSHLHPGGKIKCLEHLLENNVTKPENIMCLDSANTADPCKDDAWRGAPVVLNRVLWGIASSWRPEYCEKHSSIFVNLLSPEELSSWIRKTIGGNNYKSRRL